MIDHEAGIIHETDLEARDPEEIARAAGDLGIGIRRPPETVEQLVIRGASQDEIEAASLRRAVAIRDKLIRDNGDASARIRI